ncbi:MAG: PHP domain-containing protein, partial [Gemmatimonadales bacterium]
MFTHLHVHSHFSFGIGVSSPDALAEAAARQGFRALACSDTNGVYGAVEFQRACAASGIRPILGAHLVADGQEVVALPTDERGWGALCRAITRIHWSNQSSEAGRDAPVEKGAQGVERKGCQARPDETGASLRAKRLEKLLGSVATDREGLILLSRDPAFLEQTLRLSGRDNLYAELRPGSQRHQTMAAARRLGLPVVATNGVVAADAEEWSRHRLLRAIALNTTLSALPAAELWPQRAWLCPPSELARHFPDCPQALSAAEEIAERCGYTIPIGNRTVPPRTADTAG